MRSNILQRDAESPGFRFEAQLNFLQSCVLVGFDIEQSGKAVQFDHQLIGGGFDNGGIRVGQLDIYRRADRDQFRCKDE